MKAPFIRELKPNDISTVVCLVQSKEIRQKRTGEPYLSLLLSDRSGEIDAKMWDNVAEVMDQFETDDFIKIKGLMQIYNNRSQITIHKLRKVEEQEVDFRDFLPASLRDPEEMWAELRAIVAGLSNQHIRLLLDAFLDDPEIAPRFKIAPAAKSIHHAYRSGLLEHVLSLCGLAKLTAGHYPVIDLNLMIAGCILHDIGKIYELSYDRGFSYSAEGQLLGHIAIGMRMFGDKIRQFPEFPAQLRNVLEHIILSHHGKLEFGSPKVPVFPEALLMHYLDDLDSKMECMRVQLEKDPLAAGFFTGYSPSLERVTLRKSRYLDVPDAAPDAVPEPAGNSGDRAAAATADGATKQTSTDFESSSITPSPGRTPSPAPTPKPASTVSSTFGTKLQLALHDERK